MSFFHSVEFYIILAVIAAAIVAFSARPSARGPVEEYLVAGDLSDSPTDTPKIEVYCPDSGGIELWRYGVDGLTDTGALSLAITKKGNDLMIEERLTPGRGALLPPQQAYFRVKYMPPGRYHVRYNSQRTGLFAAFPLHITPGLRTSRELGR